MQPGGVLGTVTVPGLILRVGRRRGGETGDEHCPLPPLCPCWCLPVAAEDRRPWVRPAEVEGTREGQWGTWMAQLLEVGASV